MVVFFCKQKTAYEMRSSDWSSDVCSSDLTARRAWENLPQDLEVARKAVADGLGNVPVRIAVRLDPDHEIGAIAVMQRPFAVERLMVLPGLIVVSEPLELGRASCREECVSTCSSRWSPCH